MKKILKVCVILLFLPMVSLRAADFYFMADAAASSSTIDQWYLTKINAKDAWQISKSKKKVVVAVLDTGIDMNHPDLQKNIWVNMDELGGDKIDNDGNGYIDDVNGWDFLNSTPDPQPKFNLGYTKDAVNHGTFVAGMIAALHNNLYIDGVSIDVKIMPLLALNSYGYGDSYPVAEAINYAIDNGAEIINLSFGGVFHSQALKSAVLRAFDAGIVVVAAAGNTDNGGKDISAADVYPICYDKEWKVNAVIGVAAIDENDKKAQFSNYGADCVDISAPGVNFSGLAYHDVNNSDFYDYVIKSWKGTSFATALVSGAAAVIKSSHPDWTNVQIIKTLLGTAKNIDAVNNEYVGKLGAGRVDLAGAVVEAEKSNYDLIKIFVAGAGGAVSGFNADSNFEKSADFKIFGGDIGKLTVTTADVDKDDSVDIIVGGDGGTAPWVRAMSLSGKLLVSFLAYPLDYQAGINVAAGDVDNDGNVEIITATKFSEKPEIKIFDLQGELKKRFNVGLKKTGIDVAVGDVDADGLAEIIVGTGVGVVPEVKIFDATGKLKKSLKVFVRQFRGGVNIRVRDVNADGRAEIIAAAGPGGGPQIIVLDFSGKKLANFFAFDKKIKTGIWADAADIDSDGAVELLVAKQSGKDRLITAYALNGELKKSMLINADVEEGCRIVVK